MDPWQVFVAAGIAGLGLGVGLLIGAFAIRGLRHFMYDVGLDPDRNRRRKDTDDDQ